MKEKNTQDLSKILGSTHVNGFKDYCAQHKLVSMEYDESFSVYLKEIVKEKKIKLKTVFLKADIPERYGYKLLSGQRHTRERDIILRICYAAELTLDETQRALKKYGMSPLYPKVPRDALLMILFNERPGNIIDVNLCLDEHLQKPLHAYGLNESH